MAAALMRKMIDDPSARIESAGVDTVSGETPTAEAVQVMNEFGVDLSGHRSRDIAGLSLADFDIVVAMSEWIAEDIEKYLPSPSPHLEVWNVMDPFGRGLEAYRETVNNLNLLITDLLAKPWLRAVAAPAGNSACASLRPPKSKSNITEMRKQLCEYVSNGINRLDTGKLSGSHLVGVGTKAFKCFEIILHDLLGQYLSTCNLDYDSRLRARLGGKPFDRLTLGQVIQCYRMINRELARCYRSLFPENGRLRGSRKLMNGSLEKRLDRINSLRAKTVHYNEPVQADVQMKRIRELLSLISDVLAEPLFDLPKKLP
jgi:protein-tyrosine phosphatase